MSNASSKPHHTEPKGFPAQGAQVPWSPAQAVIVAVLALVGAQLVSTILLMTFIGVVGMGRNEAEHWINSTGGQFVFVLLSDAFILLALWWFLRQRKAGFKLLGLTRKPTWRDGGYAVAAYLIYLAALMVVFFVAQAYTSLDLEQRQDLGFDNLLGSGQLIMAFISLVVLPPIVEEIVFRGFVFTGLRKKLKFIWATLVTSLVFAGPHLLASEKGLLWVAGIDTLILSFALCYLREKTGALWAPMAVHAIKNTVAFVFLLTAAVMLY